MHTDNTIDINRLGSTLMNAEAMPDLKRLYIYDRLQVEKNPDQRELLAALLDGYDRGLIDVRFDFWDGTVKYRALDTN